MIDLHNFTNLGKRLDGGNINSNKLLEKCSNRCTNKPVVCATTSQEQRPRVVVISRHKAKPPPKKPSICEQLNILRLLQDSRLFLLIPARLGCLLIPFLAVYLMFCNKDMRTMYVHLPMACVYHKYEGHNITKQHCKDQNIRWPNIHYKYKSGWPALWEFLNSVGGSIAGNLGALTGIPLPNIVMPGILGRRKRDKLDDEEEEKRKREKEKEYERQVADEMARKDDPTYYEVDGYSVYGGLYDYITSPLKFTMMKINLWRLVASVLASAFLLLGAMLRRKAFVAVFVYYALFEIIFHIFYLLLVLISLMHYYPIRPTPREERLGSKEARNRILYNEYFHVDLMRVWRLHTLPILIITHFFLVANSYRLEPINCKCPTREVVKEKKMIVYVQQSSRCLNKSRSVCAASHTRPELVKLAPCGSRSQRKIEKRTCRNSSEQKRLQKVRTCGTICRTNSTNSVKIGFKQEPAMKKTVSYKL